MFQPFPERPCWNYFFPRMLSKVSYENGRGDLIATLSYSNHTQEHKVQQLQY